MKKPFTIVERGHPLFAVTQVTRKVQEKRAVLRRLTHVLCMKKPLDIVERGHPLFADSGRASSEIPEWLQEFRENLVDDEVPEHRDSHASSSHEVSSDPTSKRP